MKKLFLFSLLSLLSLVVFAQEDPMTKLAMEALVKDKAKSDASIQDPKSNTKAATWMSRAKTYESIATQFSQIDSSAAITAYEAYQKVIELDVTKKGDKGRSAKEAEAIISGKEGSLYNAFIRQGAEKYQNQNIAGALDMFKMAAKVNEKDTLGTLYGAISAQQVGKIEEAKGLFENYIKNGGVDASVFYGLSQLYRNDKDIDKAINTLDRGIKAAGGGNKDLEMEKLNIYLVTEQEDKAVAYSRELAQKYPKEIQIALNLAITYDNQNIKVSRDIRDVQDKLDEVSGKQDEVKRDIASEKDKIELYDGEVKRIAARLKAQPKNADLKRQLADATATLNDAKKNLTKLEADLKAAEAAEAKVDKSALQKQLTDLKAKQQEIKSLAMDSYAKAIEIDPDNYDAVFNLGVFYFNDAVEMKREVDAMDMQTFQKSGKEMEGKVCAKFQKAKPYFVKASSLRDDEVAKQTLETLNNVLKEYEGKGVVCKE
jgi:tetratricopeptide (TPR) repeat protein